MATASKFFKLQVSHRRIAAILATISDAVDICPKTHSCHPVDLDGR